MKTKIINKPVSRKEISFDELYEDISADWKRRAKQLQARRWHKLRRKMAAIEEDFAINNKPIQH